MRFVSLGACLPAMHAIYSSASQRSMASSSLLSLPSLSMSQIFNNSSLFSSSTLASNSYGNRQQSNNQPFVCISVELHRAHVDINATESHHYDKGDLYFQTCTTNIHYPVTLSLIYSAFLNISQVFCLKYITSSHIPGACLPASLNAATHRNLTP